MNINLHIERLVLEGIALEPHQRITLKEDVESALKQQLVNQGIGSTTIFKTNQTSARGGSISNENNHGMESLGHEIGIAVYRGIDK